MDAINRLDVVAGEYAERYAAFRHCYAGLEDGHATDRVLQRLGL